MARALASGVQLRLSGVTLSTKGAVRDARPTLTAPATSATVVPVHQAADASHSAYSADSPVR